MINHRSEARTIQEAIIEAKSIATLNKNVVSFMFNGIEVRVDKDTQPDLIYRDWDNAWDMGVTHVGPRCVKNYDKETIRKIEINKTRRQIASAKRSIEFHQREIKQLEDKLESLKQ